MSKFWARCTHIVGAARQVDYSVVGTFRYDTSSHGPLRERAAPLTAQFLRFGLVGVVGFIVDASVLRLVVALLGLNLYVGRVVSFLAAATVTWALNRTFTFRHKGARGSQWLKFVLANALGGFVNFGTYAAMVSSMPFVHAHPVIAVAAGSLAGMGFNFTLSKWVVFR